MPSQLQCGTISICRTEITNRLASCAAGVTRRRAPKQAPLQGGQTDGGDWEEDEDEAAAARVLRAPPPETDEDFEREFAELMGGEPKVRLQACRNLSKCR